MLAEAGATGRRGTVGDAAATDEDTPLEITVPENDADADGDRLTVVEVSRPALGTATTDGEVVQHTPAPDVGATTRSPTRSTTATEGAPRRP